MDEYYYYCLWLQQQAMQQQAMQQQVMQQQVMQQQVMQQQVMQQQAQQRLSGSSTSGVNNAERFFNNGTGLYNGVDSLVRNISNGDVLGAINDTTNIVRNVSALGEDVNAARSQLQFFRSEPRVPSTNRIPRSRRHTDNSASLGSNTRQQYPTDNVVSQITQLRREHERLEARWNELNEDEEGNRLVDRLEEIDRRLRTYGANHHLCSSRRAVVEEMIRHDARKDREMALVSQEQSRIDDRIQELEQLSSSHSNRRQSRFK